MFPRLCSLVAVAAACVVLAGSALAQGVDDVAIVGVVTDSTGAVVAGATVTLSSPSLIGGSRHAETRKDGTYRFTALSPGTYDVSVALAGFRTTRQSGVRLVSGATLTVDVRLEVGGVSDVFEVRGQAPLVDVKSASSPNNLVQEMLQALPANRWLPDVINLTPGVAADVAYGGSQGSNGMFVDGVDITSPQFQDAWGRFNYNWVQEVQVVGLGASAEHDGFTGVSARSVLRSGSNRYSGLAEFWTTTPDYLSDNTSTLSQALQTTFHSKQLIEYWDLNAQIGGPLRHDRLWFFGGAQRVVNDYRPAGYPFSGSTREDDPRYLLKLSAAPSASTRLEGFVEGGVYSTIAGGLDAYTPAEASSDIRQPQVAWNTRLTWTLGGRTLLEARAGGNVMSNVADPHAPGTRSGPAPHYDLATYMYSGNAPMFYEYDGSKQSASATLTHEIDHVLGRYHQFKFGVEYERSSAKDSWGTPGNVYYMDYAGEPYLAYIRSPSSLQATTSRVSVYAQDDWQLSDHLTLSPGLRATFNHGSAPQVNNVFGTSPVSPRLGVAWDVGADHRMVARLHYGRYYDTTFSSRIEEADASNMSPTVLASVSPTGVLTPIETYPPANSLVINPDIRQSYVDQWVVGLERQLLSHLSGQAQYIRRRFGSFMGMVDVGSVWAPTPVRDPGPDGVVGTADDGPMVTIYKKTNPGNEAYEYANPDNATRQYDAVQLIGKRRYADGWQMQASYTWSKSVGTVSNLWHVNAARYDLGNPGSFVNPNTFIYADGHSPFDFTHEFKVLGSYRIPLAGGWLVSGVYRYHTGYAWTRVFRVPYATAGTNSVRAEPRGSRRSAAINRMDLRIEKHMVLPGVGQLGLFVDLLNACNQGVPNAEAVSPVVEMSGPNLGNPRTWVDPRTVRIGLRFSF